jgi:hypothetical protein
LDRFCQLSEVPSIVSFVFLRVVGIFGMTNLILLVQSPDDTAALVPAIAGLKALSPAALWLVHSPAILVDLGASNAQMEQQIVAINQAIKDCIGREDYTGAEQYKQQRHALTLQKATAATEGYKTMSPEAVQAATERVFGTFWEAKVAPKMQITMHTQHHETRDWIEMLNSMKGRWPAEMIHGGFIVAWPGQFVGNPPAGVNWPKVAADVLQSTPSLQSKIPPTAVTPAAPSTPAVEKKPRKPASGYMGHPRFKQLCSMGLDALSQIVLTYQMNPNTMDGNRMKMVHAVGKYEEGKNLLDNPKL